MVQVIQNSVETAFNIADLLMAFNETAAGFRYGNYVIFHLSI